ncbi:MAG: prephenate dehydratase [Acidobacteriota bacterium]|nr:prephenate dehydratase [Acidobacteriota bacterium]
MNDGRIENPRAEIDRIDTELLGLLNRRAEIALKVGEAKKQVDTSLCDHNREREVIERLCSQNPGPLGAANVASIFQRIMDECLHIQQSTYQTEPKNHGADKPQTGLNENARVAFLGERGTFSEEAVIGLLGENCELRPRPTFEKLFAAIGEGEADYILVPLENTLVGSVHRCYDLLLESSLNIVAEIILPISHFLIGCPGASLETIKTVESHPVALAQCERFFAAHPHLNRIAADDTAGAARRTIESGDLTRAAIAGKRAAKIYGGAVLQEHLEDHSENFTRFAMLSNDSNISNQGNKISLIVRLAHRPGALHDALRPFVRRGIDLLKIESRPIKGRPWQYNFYLDLQAPASESELRGAVDETRDRAEEVRYLGRYSSVEIPNDR